jgi:hypothetical protein
MPVVLTATSVPRPALRRFRGEPPEGVIHGAEWLGRPLSRMKRLRYQRPTLGIGLNMALAIGTVVGVLGYWFWSDENAWAGARRPKWCKWANSPRLRRAVAGKFRLDWSQEQIAGWLKRTHPKDDCNQVSHDTIWRARANGPSSFGVGLDPTVEARILELKADGHGILM